MMTTTMYCCAKVRSGGNGFRIFYADCKNKATVERDERFYCKIHDPEARRLRAEKISAGYREKRRVAGARAAFVRECEIGIRKIAAGETPAIEIARIVLAREFAES